MTPDSPRFALVVTFVAADTRAPPAEDDEAFAAASATPDTPGFVLVVFFTATYAEAPPTEDAALAAALATPAATPYGRPAHKHSMFY